MARSFQDVLNEISARSDPQRNIVLNQISQIPAQQAADESGLEAKKNQAYDDILGGARQRGLGFSGIPLSEQAKYNATDYVPALANLKSQYSGRKSTLESALADIGKSDYSTAYDIFNQDRNFEEQQRQFNENLAEQRRQAAASAASNNTLSSLFGGAGTGNQAATATPKPQTDPLQQRAYNAVRDLLSVKDKNVINNTFNAIQKSAGYGNSYDKIKLQLLMQMAPDMFGNRNGTNAIGNASQLRF